MRRLLLLAGALTAASLVLPAAASAHGLVGRADLPVPQWLFGWGAAVVLVVSFLALAMLWKSPVLEQAPARQLVRIPRVLDVTCGAIGVALFALLVYAGFAGSQVPTANALPTFAYVLFWVGLVPVSALLGDVFRAFNPWRALGRAAGWTVQRFAGGSMPPPLDYPGRLGHWPAAAGLVAFGWLELVAGNGDDPSVLATAALLYATVQLVGMSVYGVERWCERADAFGVYFGLFARMSALAVQDGHLAVRPPLSGLAGVRPLPGTVAFLCAAIGITAFDGATEGATWNAVAPELQQSLIDLGLSAGHALTLTFSAGLVAFVALVAAFYRLGVEGMRSTTRRAAGELGRAFAHSLVPIALGYVFAHYFSLLVFQGQATAYLASDPLGDGSDLFGTASASIDYGVLSAATVWYVQVLALVLGHAGALALSHDRALTAFGASRTAVRSQYWMLAVMVGFTSLGLWLLSAANA